MRKNPDFFMSGTGGQRQNHAVQHSEACFPLPQEKPHEQTKTLTASIVVAIGSKLPVCG